jgi:hypothetical protein
MALPYELQVPVLVVDRARLFVVNRGFFTFSTPELFVHRVELHALIDDRYRLFGGLLLDGQSSMGVGGVFGVGGRLGRR